MNGPQVEINGVATLCFNEDGTWFQGSITTDDDSQFVIYGTKSARRRMGQEQSTSDHCGCSPIEEGPGVPVTFDIRVVDCEVGEEYSLKRVHGRNGELCTFSCSSINFTTENVYRGQKADLISKHCLGHKMAGKRTHVYRGPIRLNCVATPRNFHWVMWGLSVFAFSRFRKSPVSASPYLGTNASWWSSNTTRWLVVRCHAALNSSGEWPVLTWLLQSCRSVFIPSPFSSLIAHESSGGCPRDIR